MNLKTTKNRNSAIELLRVIAMLLIVVSHSAVHGQYPLEPSSFSLNQYILEWFNIGNIGVDIFMLITGYFLCQKDNTTKSVAKLHAQVLFYAILGLLIYSCFRADVPIRDIGKSFLPLITNSYWFFTAYIVFILFTPYLNMFLKLASRVQHMTCICIMILLWSITPTLIGKDMYGSELMQFAMFYVIGAYFKKYPNNKMQKIQVRCLVVISLFALLLLSNVLVHWVENYISLPDNLIMQLYHRNSFLVVGIAIGLFSIAIYSKVFYNKFINILGACTFGVYLFHDNFLIRKLIWTDWLGCKEYYHTPFLGFYLLGSVLVVYMLCSLIEYLRERIVEKRFLKIYMILYNGMLTLMKKLRNYCVQ